MGAAKLARPCRIYAPVGTHETLLAYLVRRLLENGANSSFVHRIWDATISPDDLARDPAAEARAIVPLGAPHPAVVLPAALYGAFSSEVGTPNDSENAANKGELESFRFLSNRKDSSARANSRGADLADEATLAEMGKAMQTSAARQWHAAPMIPGHSAASPALPISNPADRRDLVGTAAFAMPGDVAVAFEVARSAAPTWQALPVDERAACLEAAADALTARMDELIGLIIREAGKSAANAVAEIREAVDFLRYYAAEARATLTPAHAPLGPVVCISPWNFPLAIFTGQIAAALAAGNVVLAKPAEETPLIAAAAVRILHASGIPTDVLQLLPGAGDIGAALVAHPQVAGVLFTGSTEVARLIARELATHDGAPIPLIAETGGQNAMIVDSSALAEQVSADVLASAFDSAGQRCSALRVLCLQEDIAERQMAMLRGAIAELSVGNPDRLATDIGPVITEEARASITAHIGRMRGMGCAVWQAELPAETAHGSFVAPTIIEVATIAQIGGEVFGPVLHVLRFARDGLPALIEAINATGYGLTFGLHTRLDETIAAVTGRIAAGNLYINRNTIGAVVGVQPFGGRGLSGTGPKAGGPLYLGRLLRQMPVLRLPGVPCPAPAVEALVRWLVTSGDAEGAAIARGHAAASLLGAGGELPGPVGESNIYALHPRGVVLAVALSRSGLVAQLAAALGAGNRVTVWWRGAGPLPLDLPAELATLVTRIDALPGTIPFAAMLIEPGAQTRGVIAEIAAMAGPIPLIQMAGAGRAYRADWLVEEQSTSINTTAAGGNARLMALV